MPRPSVRAARRAEIVDAFARVLADHGYAGATIQAVAATAGVSPGLLHHHFANKDDLLEALLTTLIERFRDRVRARSATIPGEPLRAYIDAAVALDAGADRIAARCWVGVLAEALRQPRLLQRVRRHLATEVEHLARISATDDAHVGAAVLASILGALVFGAFAPAKTAGFAAPALQQLATALGSGAQVPGRRRASSAPSRRQR